MVPQIGEICQPMAAGVGSLWSLAEGDRVCMCKFGTHTSTVSSSLAETESHSLINIRATAALKLAAGFSRKAVVLRARAQRSFPSLTLGEALFASRHSHIRRVREGGFLNEPNGRHGRAINADRRVRPATGSGQAESILGRIGGQSRMTMYSVRRMVPCSTLTHLLLSRLSRPLFRSASDSSGGPW